MADPVDNAQGRIEQNEEIWRRQRAAREALKPVSHYCVECDRFIPQARQQATGGTDHCIDCAELGEQRGRR